MTGMVARNGGRSVGAGVGRDHDRTRRGGWGRRVLGLALLLIVGTTGGVAVAEPEAAIALGPAEELASMTVPADGGTLTVIRPGHRLDGMTVVIPAGAWPAARPVSVWCQEISSHTLGMRLNPLTPMLRIDAGADPAAEVIAVRVPLTLSPGRFAMGFYWDETTGRLEGMPMASLASGAIEIVTRHFHRPFVISGPP